MEPELSRYLDGVLDRVGEHGAAMLQRAVTTGAADEPLEVHIVDFPTQDLLDNFMGDERRALLAPELERILARMEILRVDLKPVPQPMTVHEQFTN